MQTSAQRRGGVNGLPDKPRFTVREMARLWSVSERTVYRWIERRQIVAEHTHGGAYRIPREYVVSGPTEGEALSLR
jgi:excisionase family DNA binding protein